jgi:hypothetical protein
MGGVISEEDENNYNNKIIMNVAQIEKSTSINNKNE